ncbi:M13 family peptidase [Sphingomonas parva]|uniref:M13 family peptidase n=1 Tax=Sphingomonas parva TaxID=2555898 RepID=A0A4Y8ZVT6_9SPHN|nr:M13 family metallopeptidase [Sphingomonas parva]TFI59442.1 M13 family peptidase [Sphingomonas parva]
MRKSFLILSAFLLTGAATPALADAAAQSPATAMPQAAKARYGTWGADLGAMDRSVKPGDDFWRYVNGNWDKSTQIAADRTSAGVGVLLVDQAEAQVKAIVEDLARDPAKSGQIGRQLGDFYASWMDEAAIEARGIAPLKPYLARIDAVRSRSDLIKLFARPGYMSPIGIGILPDPADPTRYIAAAGQGGLGLPNRDYYLLEGAKYDAIRKGYRDYIVKIHQLAGLPDGETKADRIIALETALARVHWDPARQRDIKQIYNPMNRAQLTELAPQLEWPAFLEASGLAGVDTVIAAEKSAITETGKLLDTIPLQTWKDYSTFHFISANAPYLPKAFDQANFDFYSKTLRGVPQQRERWKRGVQQLNTFLGEGVGRVYVERHYPAESNRQMTELIANLRAGLETRLAASTWMDESTKAQARAKLAAFDPRIGHPAKWIDYSSLKVDRNDLLGNAIRGNEFAWNLQLSRLGKPVDRALWDMNPQEVNAYYNPLMNQITVPAAILQAPYFDPAADPAVNYGGIGAIIGHEIGHGFDDQGRQFDASGKIRDWWTATSGEQFTARAAKLGAQYDQYEAIPGTRINGKLTMGENIGDLGGLEMAYAAYRRHVAQHGEPPVIDGMTGDQRFFIAYAQAWRSKIREDALRERLLTDPHSPPYYRVNGIVRNVDAWYKAFDVKPGDKMYLPPEQRVSIW